MATSAVNAKCCPDRAKEKSLVAATIYDLLVIVVVLLLADAELNKGNVRG